MAGLMIAIVTTYCCFQNKTFKIRRWDVAKSELTGSTWRWVSAGDLWGHSGLWHGSWPLRVTAVDNSSKSQLLSTQLRLENLSPELLLLQLINSPHSHYCFYDGFEDTVKYYSRDEHHVKDVFNKCMAWYSCWLAPFWLSHIPSSSETTVNLQ